MKNRIISIIFLLLFLVLAFNILQMPSSFTVDALSYNDAIWHYVENTVSETGATNIIAAIIADYRAFDTLGETIVLFTSIVAVASILKATDSKKENG
jgi:multisubunit Na+/H+ antiporter MnhB subunit